MANFKRKHKKYSSSCHMCKFEKIYDIPHPEGDFCKEWIKIHKKPQTCKKLKAEHVYEVVKERHMCWPNPFYILQSIGGKLKPVCNYWVELKCNACGKKESVHLPGTDFFGDRRMTKKQLKIVAKTSGLEIFKIATHN